MMRCEIRASGRNLPKLRLCNEPARYSTNSTTWPSGSVTLKLRFPDGHVVEFVEYRAGSLHSRNFGKFLPDARYSTNSTTWPSGSVTLKLRFPDGHVVEF